MTSLRSSPPVVVLQTVALLVFTTILVGCGPSLSPVTGTVKYKGEPVKGGMLIFSPEGTGESAAATIKDDGTYALQTGTSSGAILGKATVVYSAPGGEASTDPKKDGKPSPYFGLVVKTPKVEIKSGGNTIDIELEKGK